MSWLRAPFSRSAISFGTCRRSYPTCAQSQCLTGYRWYSEQKKQTSSLPESMQSSPVDEAESSKPQEDPLVEELRVKLKIKEDEVVDLMVSLITLTVSS
jgi:hypothetical protein